MPHPDPEALAWASAALGTEVTVVRSLRLGGSPWLLRAGDRNVVLRISAAEQAGERETEVAAMTAVARAAKPGLPVAEVLGYDLAKQTGHALLLTAQLPGSSVIPAEPEPEHLRALGAAAARISSITLSPTRALPVRRRPIEAEDFARMRREQEPSDLLRAAEAAVAAARLDDDQTGRDVPYWDTVAALASPPDMGWFPESMAAQGRPDLTREVMLRRRDTFLAAALSHLETAG